MSTPPITDNEIRKLLVFPLESGLDWRGHGIGFMKAYIDPDKRWRINVYHEMLRVPGISLMHDHPWGLFSHVRAGQLVNTRWHRSHKKSQGAVLFNEGRINCADYAGLEGTPQVVPLVKERREVYHAGDFYRQNPEEIHETTALNGTVTLLERIPVHSDGRAHIFWPMGEEYGDATRKISDDEIYAVAASALGTMG
jgi:hypothetical protein